jgi:7-cyano-7-deazaguanine synthase
VVLSRHDHVVLLSGGVDSATVLAMLTERGAPTTAVWVRYGQAAAEAEEAASRAVAAHFGVPWTCVTVAGNGAHGSGEILGRNDLLVAVAALGRRDVVIALGIHAGTGYPDCSPSWLSAWERLTDLQRGGSLPIAAPLIDLNKTQVYELAESMAVPLELTHSCEAANSPCMSCRSCLDRKALDARA